MVLTSTSSIKRRLFLASPARYRETQCAQAQHRDSVAIFGLWLLEISAGSVTRWKSDNQQALDIMFSEKLLQHHNYHFKNIMMVG